MKKQHKTIKSFLCGVVCFATMLSCMSAFTAPVFSAPAGYNSEVASTYSRLQNTYAKIKNGETVNVAYLGGSVTNGYAGNGMDCQSNGKSWRALTFKWLSETFKTQVSSTATFVQNHCAIGGTGSDLNNYRVANALKFGTSGMADLAFIEFAINDSYELLNYEKSKQYMETIVRKCLTANPNMDIVIVITTDNGDEKRNKEFANAKAHADVAVAYDLPYIYLGKHMWDFLLTKNSNPLSIWSNYYADGCHPHEGGHAKYYDFILNNILVPELEKAQEIGTTTLTAKTLPTEWQTNDRYINSHEVLISQLESFNGFGFDGTAGSSNLNTTTGGASFKLNFKGTGIGVRFTGSNKSGVGRYRIDGGEWKDYNFYKSGSGTEHIMLEEDLSYGEHTMDFIVRKTTNGSYLRIDSFFINGDPEKTPLSFGTPPNNVPISEELKVNVVINPNELNTVISGGGFTNTGSTMSFVESEVDDVDTLKYVPNQSSADVVASDLYNSKLLSVNNTEYKYAIIGYHYLVPDGVTSTAENMALNFLNLPLTPKSKAIPSANKIQKNIGDTLIFDLSYFKAKGMNAKFKQLHIYPFGYNVKGNQTNEGEIMHIKHLTFVSDYPFATPDAIIETSDIGTTSGATVAPSTYNGTDVIKVTANGEAYLLAESLDAKELLPSVYKYAMIEYYSDSAAKPVLEIPTTDAGVAVSATGKIINGENGLKKAIFNLSEITENGQYNFYKDAKLYPFGKASSSDVMDIKSFAFYASYPDPNAMFDATFNLNGGVGDVPSSFSGKLGDKIIFPACNAKNGDKVFVGWSTKPTDTSFVSEYYMPEGGIDFYAIWAEPVIKYVSATDTSISYNGESHAVDHTSLADAISALDKNGGIIIMTGSQPFTALNGITNDALTVSIIGADETAKLTGYTSNYNLKSPLSFENITFVCENTSSNPHFFGGGYKLTIGKNCKMIKGEALSRFEIVAGNGSVASSTIELSSATYGCISATYAQNYNGTNTYIINDGTYNTALELGLRSTPSGTFRGNAILVVNGGVFNAGKTINCTGFVEGTGARVAVFNNDTASKTSFSLNFDYVVKSGSGGSVSVTENPTATKAPTFKAKAVGNYPIKINGVQVGVGEYTFTPSEKGTTVVTYDVPYRTITFDANGGTGTAPEQYTALIGESISLPQTTTLTNGSATFLGWSTDPAESLPITEYTVGDSDVTFYAIWAGVNTFCVNPTGDTIVVAGKTLPAPYKSLTEAANAMTSAGGTIFFTGTVGTGTSNEFNEALAKVSTTNKVILEGVGTDAKYELQCQTVNLRCNLEYRNLTIVNQHSDPFMYSNGYKIVVGRPGVENDVKVVKADNNPEAIRFFGPGGDVTINSGRYGEKFNMSGYGGNKNVNARLTVNGGNFFHSSGVNGGFYNFGSAAYTLTGNSTVIINGGTFTNPTVVWRFTGSVTGKKTAIFNNDLASTLGFTAPDADIIIRSTTDGMVSELSAGTSFLVTPKNEELIPQVNGVAMTKDTNDRYVLTPVSNGTYDITYQAPAAPEQSTVTFDANGGEGTVPHEKNGNVGSKVDLPVANLTKAGCRFVGWATTPDAPVALKTYTFPEGGATLYAVWEQQGKYYINSDGSGELTVDGVRHTAYTTLIEAGNAMTAEGGIVYFAGAIGTGTSNEGTKAFSHVTGKVIIEGVGTDATFNLELLGVEFHCDTELRNLTLSRSGDCYIYANGNELTMGEYGVENDIRMDVTMSPKLIGITENGEAKIVVNSGTFDSSFSGMRYVYSNTEHTGNFLYVINGGELKSAQTFNVGAIAFGENMMTKYTGNSTVIISGGKFHNNPTIAWNKITTMVGKRTAIFNNDMYTSAGFNSSKANYTIDSAVGGMVSELVSGTSFLVTPNEGLIPRVNGTPLTLNGDGQYVFTPEADGKYDITYTASADSYHAYGSIVIERTYGDGEAYNIEGYNSGAVLTIFSENGEKTVVNESSMTVSEHTSGKAVLNFEVALEQGTYSYTIEKNGYIMQSDSFIIENGKDTVLPTITLIGGDIKESYEAVDGDGVVDLDDFIRLLRAFSAEVDAKYRSITDIDESGETSIEDIAVIKTNFNAENEYIEEINITQFIEGEYVNKADGTFVAYTGWKRTDYINLGYAPMLLETFCNAEGGNLNWNCFYDKDKNFISAFSLGRTVAVPANAKYVIFSIQSSKTLSANLISKKRVTADIVYKPNCYIDNKNGNEVAYPNWHSTDFIEIKHPSKQLVTKSNSVSYDAIYNAFYDKDKKFISSFSLNSTVDVPIKAKYIRISQLAWKELAVELILLPPVEAKRLNTQSLIAQEFDIAPYIKEKTYIETDGREVAYSYWYSTVLTEIPLGAVAIQADTEHPYDHGYNAFYDANGNFITTFYQKKYVEIPKNAKYFRLSTSNSATLDVKFYTLNDDDSDFLNGGTPMERIAIKIPEYYTEVPASANASYLDTKIEEVPKNAKSFFFITDVHWASNAQKSNHIMAYIKAKTGIKKVLHGGDIINIHKDKPDEAVNAIKLWVDEARSYFGGDLLVAPGNHDNNTGYGGNDETVIQNSYMSYKQERYALLDGYENAIVQETDEQILARLASVNFESEEDKENMIAYYKLHYYADDDENGVRYVVMNFGTLFSGIVNKYFGINQYSENYLHMDWLYETFMSTPDGYDIVLVNHTMVRYGDHQLVGAPKVTTVLAHGMKAKNANTVAYNSKDIGEVYPMGDHIYDFSKAPNVGKIIFLGGDMHWDYSGKVSYEDGQYVCTEIESGTTISENDILIVHTQTDGVGVSSYNNIYIREPYTMTRGTVTEQCFDVVSIEDSKVTFTRVGAGHSRVYNYAE